MVVKTFKRLDPLKLCPKSDSQIWKFVNFRKIDFGNFFNNKLYRAIKYRLLYILYNINT